MPDLRKPLMISGVTLLLQATDFCEIALINNCTGDVTESSTGTHPSFFRQPKERDPGVAKDAKSAWAGKRPELYLLLRSQSAPL